MCRVVALIPARGGSKSIPHKNVRFIAGKPLIVWAVEAALGCTAIDSVFVSTDSGVVSDVISNHWSSLGNTRLKTVDRHPRTATDDASTESVMLEFAERVRFDYIVLMQATSPLTQTKHLDEALGIYMNGGYDSLVSVVRQKRFILNAMDGQAVPVNYDPLHRPRRQEWDGYLVENGAFYITSRESLLVSGNRMSGRLGYYEMPEETYYELDEPSDWRIVEGLLMDQQSVQSELAFKSKVGAVKLIVFDCDGVLTDGAMFYSESGDEIKRFDTTDGMGIRLLKEAGFLTAIVTGENSDLVARRAKKLRIDHVCLGIQDKKSTVNEIRRHHDLEWNQIAFIGDDINDVEVMSHVGLPIAVANAQQPVKEIAMYVTAKHGGHGAVREAIEKILGGLVP